MSFPGPGLVLLVSVVLAGAVWMVHRRVDRPAISYPLWLLVLVALLVPAVVSLPVLPAKLAVPLTIPGVGASEVVSAEGTSYQSTGPPPGALAPPVLAILWLLGTAGFLGWTLVRTIHFRHTLAKASRQAPASLQRQAAAIGRDLGLTRIPEIHTTNARVLPMVWWTGGKVRVLIPAFLLTDPESRGTACHPDPRAGACPPPRPPRALAGVAGLLRLLVEPGGLVGPQPAPNRRGVVL